MITRYCCLLTCWLCANPVLAQAEMRQWTSKDGQFKTQAELIGHDAQVAKLKTEKGAIIDVPLIKLSEADRKFVESQKRREAEPGKSAPTGEGPPIITPRATLKEHTKAVWCVAFSPEGKLLASGGGNLKVGGNNPGELMLWNPATGKRVATLPNQGGRVRALAFAPDGKTLAAAYEPENIINRGLSVLWSMPGKKPKVTVPFEAVALDFSADGRLLVLGGTTPPPPTGGRTSGGIKIWDVKQSRQTASLVGHASTVWAVAIAPDGRTIASGSLDRTAILWETDTGKQIAKLPEKAGSHPAIAFSPDGATLALGTHNDGSGVADEVTLFDLKTLKPGLKIKVGSNINALAFSHKGHALAVGTGWAQDGEVILLDPADGERIATLRGHEDTVKGVAFSADDKTLASGSTDGTVMLWDVPAVEHE